MHGNVQEWCRETYEEDFYGRSPEIDPYNSGRVVEYVVLRGGSWARDPFLCRSAVRDGYTLDSSDSDVGFRVCFTPD